MVVERPSQKSLRLTAMDNTGKIKIFLVMARPVEINQLYNALVERIDKRKISHPDELLCVSSSNSEEPNSEETNSSEETKNGSVKNLSDETTVAAVPDQHDSAEPSPKKPILTVEAPSTPSDVQQETANN